MRPWNCCRICLDTQNLNNIFEAPENNEKLSNAITNAVGIKIEPNDKFPQQMCSKCINFINEINKFRKKAVHMQKVLQKKIEDNEIFDIKHESIDIKLENIVIASIDYEDNCDDFRDYEDDIALINIKCTEEDNNRTIIREYESTVKDIVDQEVPFVLKNEKKKKTMKSRPVQRKLRSKKSAAITVNGKNKDDQGKEEVECEHCHKVLTSKLSLRNHYKIHTGFDFVCEHCGKKFITRRLLLMHCRAKHGYEKTDKCSFCDYRASNAEQVKIHERLHTGERPFVCKDCGAGFHRKSSYLQHIAIHLPEKTVQCDQCPARFKSVTLMRIHKSRHRLPAYRYRCAVCGNNFARRRNVARHLQRVHALQPEAEHIQRDKIS